MRDKERKQPFGGPNREIASTLHRSCPFATPCSAVKEYLVITQKDKWFSGRFDAAVLQQVLNDHAKKGWRVVSMVTASREGVLVGGDKDEIIVLLEKDVPTQAQRIEHESRLSEAARKSFGGGPAPSTPTPPPVKRNGNEPDVYRLD
jgi:hypothetical protein